MEYDNYVIKETTTVPAGRRAADAKRAGPTSIMWIKIWEAYLRSEECHTHTRHPSPGFQGQEISPHNFWLQKPVGIKSVEETSEVSNTSS